MFPKWLLSFHASVWKEAEENLQKGEGPLKKKNTSKMIGQTFLPPWKWGKTLLLVRGATPAVEGVELFPFKLRKKTGTT